jgi:hypothetical protein
MKCTWRPRSIELRDALACLGRACLEMVLEAEIKVNTEIHFKAVIERVWRCIWRPR